MFIKVFDNCAEMIFEGDSEEFLDENGWDEDLEYVLSELDSNKYIKSIHYYARNFGDIYTICKTSQLL